MVVFENIILNSLLLIWRLLLSIKEKVFKIVRVLQQEVLVEDSFYYGHPLSNVLIHLHFGGLCLDIFGWCVSRAWCVYWKREVHCALYKILRLLLHLALRTHSYYLPQLQSSNCFRRLDKNSIMILKVLHSSYSAHLMEKRLASSRVIRFEPVLPRHRMYERL